MRGTAEAVEEEELEEDREEEEEEEVDVVALAVDALDTFVLISSESGQSRGENCTTTDRGNLIFDRRALGRRQRLTRRCGLRRMGEAVGSHLRHCSCVSTLALYHLVARLAGVSSACAM